MLSAGRASAARGGRAGAAARASASAVAGVLREPKYDVRGAADVLGAGARPVAAPQSSTKVIIMEIGRLRRVPAALDLIALALILKLKSWCHRSPAF